MTLVLASLFRNFTNKTSNFCLFLCIYLFICVCDRICNFCLQQQYPNLPSACDLKLDLIHAIPYKKTHLIPQQPFEELTKIVHMGARSRFYLVEGLPSMLQVSCPAPHTLGACPNIIPALGEQKQVDLRSRSSWDIASLRLFWATGYAVTSDNSNSRYSNSNKAKPRFWNSQQRPWLFLSSPP